MMEEETPQKNQVTKMEQMQNKKRDALKDSLRANLRRRKQVKKDTIEARTKKFVSS